MNTTNKRLTPEKGHSDDISLDTEVDNGSLQQDLEHLEDAANTSVASPNLRGSQSLLGTEPDPESDDDVLQNTHEMGIAPDADLSTVTPLNLAKDVTDAEEYRRTH
jgi:hypothetical protein